MVDYEHQTLFTAQNGQPNPASGWLSGFEWIDGKELYAEVQWTAAAKQRIAGGEYRYISPVFQYTPAGDILSLLPPALTNTPALDQLDPVALAAASRLLNTLQPSQKDEAMNEAQKLMLSRCLGCLKPPARRSNWPRYSKSKAAPMAKSWPKPWPPPKRQPSRKTNRPSRTSRGPCRFRRPLAMEGHRGARLRPEGRIGHRLQNPPTRRQMVLFRMVCNSPRAIRLLALVAQ